MINLQHLTKTDLHQLVADYAHMERTGSTPADSLLRQETEKAMQGYDNKSLFHITAMQVAFTACRLQLYGKPLCP